MSERESTREVRRDMEDPVKVKRLLDWIETFGTLRNMPAQELVEMALYHMPDDISTTYEQVIEELCARVDPEWINREPATGPGGMQE